MNKVFNNKQPKIVLFCFASAMMCVLFLTIGFSAFQKELYIDNMSVAVIAQKKVRITKMQYKSSDNGGVVLSSNFGSDYIDGSITLPSNSSSVTFSIEITNFGNIEVGFPKLTLADSRLDYNITGYTEGTKLCDKTDNTQCSLGSITAFDITIKYANNATVTNNAINFGTSFNFIEAYDVTYTNISNTTNYPKGALKGENLNVTFSTDVPDALKITESNTALPANRYTYNPSTGSLTISNIVGDIVISKLYNITYILNNGTNDANNPSVYSPGETITINNPTYTGYAFLGWYQNGSFTGSTINSTGGLSGSVTLYAKWSRIYNITYNIYDGTQPSGQVYEFITETPQTILNPTKVGNDFGGWYLNSSYTGNEITSTSQLSGNAELHAKWYPIYNITYSIDTNHVSQPTGQLTSYSGLNTKTILNPTNIHDPGFQGWYRDSGLSDGPITSTSQLNGNTTLYAKFVSTITNLNFDTSTNRHVDSRISSSATINLSSYASYTYTQNSAHTTINSIKIYITYRTGNKTGNITCRVASNTSGFTTTSGTINFSSGQNGTVGEVTLNFNTPIQIGSNYTISFPNHTDANGNNRIRIQGFAFEANPS